MQVHLPDVISQVERLLQRRGLHCMVYMLRKLFGYQEDDIRVLRDDGKGRVWPTKRRILAHIDWLIGDARNGDNLFFHFSGVLLYSLKAPVCQAWRGSCSLVCSLRAARITFRRLARAGPQSELIEFNAIPSGAHDMRIKRTRNSSCSELAAVGMAPPKRCASALCHIARCWSQCT